MLKEIKRFAWIFVRYFVLLAVTTGLVFHVYEMSERRKDEKCANACNDVVTVYAYRNSDSCYCRFGEKSISRLEDLDFARETSILGELMETLRGSQRDPMIISPTL